MRYVPPIFVTRLTSSQCFLFRERLCTICSSTYFENTAQYQQRTKKAKARATEKKLCYKMIFKHATLYR